MKLSLAILFFALGVMFFALGSITPPAPAGPSFVRLDAHNWQIVYPPELPASNFVWYLEYSCHVDGPYQWCPDCRYIGTDIFINFRAHHFYRLRGITNF
jgi:hypothetical protein